MNAAESTPLTCRFITAMALIFEFEKAFGHVHSPALHGTMEHSCVAAVHNINTKCSIFCSFPLKLVGNSGIIITISPHFVTTCIIWSTNCYSVDLFIFTHHSIVPTLTVCPIIIFTITEISIKIKLASQLRQSHLILINYQLTIPPVAVKAKERKRNQILIN